VHALNLFLEAIELLLEGVHIFFRDYFLLALCRRVGLGLRRVL
jgi:Na+-transporting methylmalonyl-CoA/oxaloacetate decarboxylase gamma subunit